MQNWLRSRVQTTPGPRGRAAARAAHRQAGRPPVLGQRRWFRAAGLAFGVTVILALPAAAFAKVGVVSFEEVLAKTRQGKKISKTITSYFKRKQASINRKKKALQKEEKHIVKAFKQLEASKTILRGSVYKARKAKLEARYRKLLLRGQRLMQKVNKDNSKLQKRRYKLLQPLRQIFLTAVEALAKSKGLTVVIERSAVYYHKSAVDLTPAVISRVDASTKN